MDQVNLEALIPIIANMFGMDPTSLLFYIGLIISASNLTTRLIPDDRQGFLGIVRIATGILGIHVENRIAKGVTISDVAKKVVGGDVGGAAEMVIRDMAGEAEALIPEVIESAGNGVVQEIVQAFPGANRGPDGKFVKTPKEY